MSVYEHVDQSKQLTQQEVDAVLAERAAPAWANYLARDSRGYHYLSHLPRRYNSHEVCTGALPEGERYCSTGNLDGGPIAYAELHPVTMTMEQAIRKAKKLKSQLEKLNVQRTAIEVELGVVDRALRKYGLKRT